MNAPIFSKALTAYLSSQLLSTGQTRLKVKNDSNLMKSDHPDVQRIYAAAEALRVNMTQAGHSAELALFKGQATFYGPECGLGQQNQPILRWGQFERDLADGELEWDLDEETGNPLFLIADYQVHARLAKGADDKPLTAAQISLKLSKGKLNELLAPLGTGGDRLIIASTLEPGQEYKVVGTGVKEFDAVPGKPNLPKTQPYVLLSDGSKVKCDSYLSGQFFGGDAYVPTPDEPVTLEVYPSQRAYKGHKIANLVALPFGSDDFGELGGFDDFETAPEPVAEEADFEGAAYAV